MKKKIYSFIALLCLLTPTAVLHAAAPTTSSTNLSFNSIDGGSFQMLWTSGNGSRRIVIVKQGSPVTAVPVNGVDYNASVSGQFGSGQEIAPGEYVLFDNNVNNVNISNLQASSTYHVAIFEYNGTGAATEYRTVALTGSVTTLSAPTVQAHTVTFTNVDANSMQVNWVNGNGSRRIVLMREGSPVNVNPVDLTSYSGSGSFGSGTEIGAGSGNYVVHNSSGNLVNVTNLKPGTTYHIAIFEANGNSTPVFLTTSPATAFRSTDPRPSVPVTAVSTSLADGNSFRISWSVPALGSGARRIIVMREGTPVDAIPSDGIDYLGAGSAPFNSTADMAGFPGQKVIFDNMGSFTDVSGLNPSTTYYFRIYEYDGTGTSIAYLTSSYGSGSQATVSDPVDQPTNLSVSAITGTSFTLTWSPGTGSRRIVVIKPGNAVDANPVDLTDYSQSNFLGSAQQITPGNYVVYDAASPHSVTVSGLTSGITYHIAMFEANGINNLMYNTVNPPRTTVTTASGPTLAASNLTFTNHDGTGMLLNWTIGNGTRRIIVAREGTPVDAVPVNSVDYTPSGSSFAFNTAPEISPGQKVVYDNTGNQHSLSGLNPSTTYYFRIYEYTVSPDTAYLVSSYAEGSSATVSAPSIQASTVTFSNVTGNSIRVNWVNGNGTRRAVVARAGGPVTVNPIDIVNQNPSTNFGSGANLGGGNFLVFYSNGNFVTVTGLDLNTNYHFAVFEANGISFPVYNTTSPATGNQTTAPTPTVAPGNLTFTNVEGDQMQLNFSQGNGNSRIIVAREGSPVDEIPVNGVDYSFNTTFSLAPEISPGSGQRIVYDGISTQVNLAGLTPGTMYYFKIFEYSGTGASTGYLTSSFASGNQATYADPTVQASAINFSSVTATTAIVGFTAGNGTGRIVIARQGSPVNVTPVDLVNYAANSNYGVASSQIGTGNYVISRSSVNSVSVTNLLPGTTYHFAVFEYNGNARPMFLTPGTTATVTTIGPPAVQASAPNASSVTGTTATINWTNGSGNKRIVLVKQGTAVDAVPPNNDDFFANSFFGSGEQLGTGNYIVFDGISDFVNVTNLLPNTTYHYAIFEYNDFGTNSSQVLTTSPAVGSFVTGVLPVTLTSFLGNVNGKQVELKWTTVQEFNSDHFEVEHSIDGSTFNKTGAVAAAGESSSRIDYGFTDAMPFEGFNYYRLKQVDKDGSFKYSQIIRIKFTANRLVRKMVNPVSSLLTVELFKQPAENSYLRMYDLSGKLLRVERISNTIIRTDISRLQNGNYIVEIVSGTATETVRFVKL